MASPSDLDRMKAIVDGVDAVATMIEDRWGRGRLRLLVSDDLRTRFDAQQKSWNDSLWEYELAEVELQGAAMHRAWTALDNYALDAACKPLEPEVWETLLPDGTVLALCRDNASASKALDNADGRRIEVWSIDEVACFISNQREVREIKQVFPGATVTDVRSTGHGDPNDEIPF